MLNENLPEQNTSSRHFGLEEAVFILLIVLSISGIAITDFSPHDGYGYWLLMVPVFACLAIFVSWLQSKNSDQEFADIVKAQSVHWVLTLVVIGAAFLLNKSGQLTEISASLVILLILALSTMLDGSRIGWQFSLLGLFLAACAIIVAYVERFILASVGLGLLLIILSALWRYWLHKQSAYHYD